MVKLLLAIKHAFPWLWNVAEFINGLIFSLITKRVSELAAVMVKNEAPEGYRFSMVREEEIPALSAFLSAIPDESLKFFTPHSFSEKALRRLWRNPSFLMMKATKTEDGTFSGYFFLRCFFVGVSVAGLIVGDEYRNRGIGTAMWESLMRISNKLKFRMFATISKDNIPSLKSCGNVNEMIVRKRMRNGYMLVECKEKQTINNSIIYENND
ncbi:MAG: GNAT family N-acetyltransferase [Bacteroidales bacterium]|nr:GNAT family N-acetyltransferase [Bacteroidales bacterium]